TGVETSSYKAQFGLSDNVSCAIRGREEFPSPSVYAPKLPSVSVSPSAEIVEGSSVTLTCSSDANPAATYTWYKENQTLSQGQEGIYHFTSISSEDSGSYNCKSENQYGQINSSPILIDVQYAPKLPSVSVSPSAEIVEGSSVTLTCSSDANPAANYTWYKENINLRPLSEEPQLIFSSIQSSDSGQYYCAAENELATIFESILINVKYAPKLPSVSVSPSAEIVEGSSVNLTCSSDAKPAAKYTWYKENEDSPKASGQIFTITDIRAEHSGNYYCEAHNSRGRHNSTLHLTVLADPQYSGRVQDHCDKIRNYCTLRITDLRESDSAVYMFMFITNKQGWGLAGSPGVTLSVTDPDLQVQVKSIVHQGYSKAELRCHSSCRLPDSPSYICHQWQNPSQPEDLRKDSQYAGRVQVLETNRGRSTLRVTNLRESDSAQYHFKFTTPSFEWGSSLPGTTLTVTDPDLQVQSYEDDVESKLWFSHSQPGDITEDYQFAGRVQVLETKGGHSTLRITDLRESDSGQYHFKFKTPSFEWESSLAGTALTVTALQVQVTRITVYQSYTEAELKCHSSCSPAGRLSYVWFKNGEKIIEDSSSYKDQFYPGDFISCAFEEHKDYSSPSVYAPEVPSVSVNPSAEIMEGTLVTLTCGGDANTAAKYTWYKENQTLITEEPQLVFSSIQSSDSGLYYCIAENQLGRRTSDYMFIIVKYAPKTSSVSVSPSAEIVEGSSVTLTCSSDANPAAKYTWYKENQTLLQGPEGNYRFTSISSEDRVYYHCKSKNQYGQMNSSSLFIDVQYAPKLPSVSVSPSAEIVEGSSVTLTCSSDANPAANYTWYKEDEDSPKASGQIFTISNITAEHSGNYYCEAQNTRGRHNSTLHLTVVAGAWKSTAVGTATTVVLAVILLSVFILTRKKRAAKQSFRSGERSDYRTQYLPPGRQLDDPQDDLHYASVRFCKNQADLAVRPVQPHRHETEESVVYADVTFKRCQKSTGEDPAALYSTINKTR
uniref:B-cell receptor CD22-like n=1 Tax=Epinephelus lanceolatus TaxID=310571 RepID=UPI001445BFE3